MYVLLIWFGVVYAGGVLILGLLTLGASQDYKDRPSIIREGLDVGYGTPPSGNVDHDQRAGIYVGQP